MKISNVKLSVKLKNPTSLNSVEERCIEKNWKFKKFLNYTSVNHPIFSYVVFKQCSDSVSLKSF